MQLYLDFYHRTILIRHNEGPVLQKLRDEFHYFIREANEVPEATIQLHLTPSPELPQLVAKKILEHAIVYQSGSCQYVDYFGEALTIFNRDQNSVQIYSQDSDLLFELCFLAIHSIIGQNLDRAGLCRVHALGVSLNDKNAVIMLPSKGGKSTLLEYLLSDPEIQVISDDTPLIDHSGRVHAFPSKISLGSPPRTGILADLTWHEFKRLHYPPKWTASLAQLKSRIAVNSAQHSTLLIAGFRLSKGESRLVRVKGWRMILPLLEHMIIGFGLPQVLEMFLTFKINDLFKLAHHGIMRSYCALQLLRRAKSYHLYLGPDRDLNSRLIRDELHEN